MGMKNKLKKRILFGVTVGVTLVILVISSFNLIKAEESALCFNDINDVLNKEIDLDSSEKLVILSPGAYDSYEKNRIRLNIISKEKCNLEYFDRVFDSPLCDFKISEDSFKDLCRNCYEYNKSISLKDGIHYLKVRCADKKEINSEIIFFVDGNYPKIIESYPKDKSYVNGNFLIKYNDVFVDNAEMEVREICRNYGLCSKKQFISDCKLGEKECLFNIDLSEFSGKEIEYIFSVKNIAGKTAKSKLKRAVVDIKSPLISSFNYQINKNRAFFNIDFEEENLEEIEWIDYHEKTPVWRTLCDFKNRNKCRGIIGIGNGKHFLDIRIIDKAGNIGKYVKVSKGKSPVVGNSTAPVTIIMFGDVSEPNTKEFFNDNFEKIKEKYIDSEKAKFVFKNSPLMTENSMISAEALECVRKLSGDAEYWKMHEKILDFQENLSIENLVNIFPAGIANCLEYHETKSIVDMDIQEAKDAGASSLPMFFINKEIVIGNRNFEEFRKIINKEYIDCREGNCWKLN